MKSQRNSPKYFPNLIFDNLKRYATQWVKQYPRIPISTVTLYHYFSKFQRALDKTVPTIYAVIFRIAWAPEEILELTTHHYQMNLTDFSICEIRKTICVEAFKELETDTERYQTIPCDFKALIPAGFLGDVYKQFPKDDFLKEWSFYPLMQNEELPVGIHEPSWLLYETDTTSARQRKRRYHEARDRCREIAKKLWEGNRNLKTAEIIGSKEIREARKYFLEWYGREFRDRIIREWIQDLRPGFKGLIRN